jgi:hypothetical protein
MDAGRADCRRAPAAGMPAGVRGDDPGAQRDGAARLLRPASGAGQRAAGQPVPAGPLPPLGPGEPASQPDGAVPPRRKGPVPAERAQRIPRCIPDEQFDEVFAALPSNRDRAFWVSTGAGAAELLGACEEDADVGQQLIAVVRKGIRAVQQLPASLDAFVWLRRWQRLLRTGRGRDPGQRAAGGTTRPRRRGTRGRADGASTGAARVPPLTSADPSPHRR